MLLSGTECYHLHSVFMVVGMCQPDLNGMGVRDVMPMARWGSYLFFVLNSDGHFDVHILKGGTLLGDFLIDLYGDIDLNWDLCSDWDLTFLKNFDLDWCVNHYLFLNLMGHINFDLFVDKGRVVVLLLYIHDEWDLLSDRLKGSHGLFDFNGDLHHDWDLYSHSFNVFLGDLDGLSPLDCFLLGW